MNPLFKSSLDNNFKKKIKIKHELSHSLDNKSRDKKSKVQKIDEVRRQIVDLLEMNPSQPPSSCSNSNDQLEKHPAEDISPKLTPLSKSISAYDLSKILLDEPFRNINDRLHIYIPERRYYKLIQGDALEKTLRKMVPEHYKKYVNSYTIKELDIWLRAEDTLYIETEKSEANLRNYVNFRNGILDVTTGEKLSSFHNLYFTNYVDIDYPFDEDSLDELSGTTFMKYITSISGGDKEIELLIQEVLGLALSEVRDLKVAIFLYGMPDSGKSLFLQLLQVLVGNEFCSNVSLQQITSDQYSLAELVDKKLNTFGETSEINISRLDIFKALSGNDVLTARQIYQKPFKFRNRALLVFGGNNLPSLKTIDSTDAFFNRMQIIPFLYSIPKKNQDPLLLDKLLNEGPFIAHYAMQGLKRILYRRKLSECKKAEELKNEYRRTENSFHDFIESVCTLDDCSYQHSYEIIEAYYEYCEKYKLKSIAKTDIHKILKLSYKLEYKKKTSTNGSKQNGYKGIRLNQRSNILEGTYRLNN